MDDRDRELEIPLSALSRRVCKAPDTEAWKGIVIKMLLENRTEPQLPQPSDTPSPPGAMELTNLIHVPIPAKSQRYEKISIRQIIVADGSSIKMHCQMICGEGKYVSGKENILEAKRVMKVLLITTCVVLLQQDLGGDLYLHVNKFDKGKMLKLMTAVSS